MLLETCHSDLGDLIIPTLVILTLLTLKHGLKSILHGDPSNVLSGELQNCYKKVPDMEKDC